MTTRMAAVLGKAAVVTGLAATLGFGGGLDGLMAQQADGGTYFDTQAVPAGVLHGSDAGDPYAPIDLGGASMGSLRLVGIELGGLSGSSGADDPCSPVRCKAW